MYSLTKSHLPCDMCHTLPAVPVIPLTHNHQYPYLVSWVWFCTGKGMGQQFLPRGYPGYSLLEALVSFFFLSFFLITCSFILPLFYAHFYFTYLDLLSCLLLGEKSNKKEWKSSIKYQKNL